MARRTRLRMSKTDRQLLEAMLQAFAEAHERTLQALDRADREIAETGAYFAAKRTSGSPGPNTSEADQIQPCTGAE